MTRSSTLTTPTSNTPPLQQPDSWPSTGPNSLVTTHSKSINATTPATIAPVLTTGLASTRARYKKLNFRQSLHILRELSLDIVDDSITHGHGQKAETGVEKSEEGEIHLQAALRSEQAAAAGSKVKKTDIPVRPAVISKLPYQTFYSRKFNEPATYIRFSSTVEDCIGCPYDLDEDDAIFLEALNQKKPNDPCSEEDFEQVMHGFESAATEKQPYSALDGAEVLSFEELESSLIEWIEADGARRFCGDIYPHWRTRRLKLNNKHLAIGLKSETGADTDDADPYVCFRRRELRQTRKTRGRDAHSAEKLKKLRKELEDARELMNLVKHREFTKREQLDVDRQVFEQRTNLRQVKLNLPESYRSGDDDLLLNQKKKKPLEITHRQTSQASRAAISGDIRFTEDQLVSLSELLSRQESEIQEQIDLRIGTHQRWNDGWVDLTTSALIPSTEPMMGSGFRRASMKYLPTPPASISSDQAGDCVVDSESADVSPSSLHQTANISTQALGLSLVEPSISRTSFRRRIGRGGRLWIDRSCRKFNSDSTEPSVQSSDRYNFDMDNEEEDTPTFYFDPFSSESLQFRASMLRMPMATSARRSQESIKPSKPSGPND